MTGEIEILLVFTVSVRHRQLDASPTEASLIFKARFHTDGFYLQGGSGPSLLVTYPNPRPILVRFTQPETLGLPNSRGEAVCEVSCELEPKDTVRKTFEALHDGRRPDGMSADQEEKWKSRFGESFTSDATVPADLLPEGSAAFCAQLRSDLYLAAREATESLRWRFNLGGSHFPLTHISTAWSIDATVWHPLPERMEWRVVLVPYIYPNQHEQDELEKLIVAKIQEPIAHNLLREAWDERGRNRRSALLIGVTALEVGVKTYFAGRIPPATWLLENLPSPPMETMLREFLPKTTTPNTIGGQVKAPPDDVLAEIKKAIHARNKLAHAAGTPPDADRVESWLNAIRDILYLLDYYSGHKWALSHIQQDVLSKLGA